MQKEEEIRARRDDKWAGKDEDGAERAPRIAQEDSGGA